MQPIVLNTKPYCNCHSTGKWKVQDGYTLDVESGLWVHTRCRKPSQMNYMRNQLGLQQIPQRRGPEDIYITEMRYEARAIVRSELNWTEVRDEDAGWNWGPDAD
jgi:hypothetical protein